jgi:hypothetical protein
MGVAESGKQGVNAPQVPDGFNMRVTLLFIIDEAVNEIQSQV